MKIIDVDEQFFADHPDRQARIRNQIGKEMEGEFFSLGPHEKNRRRIICWKVPKDNPYRRKGLAILRIPMLLFSDESIEDTDAVVLKVLNELMVNAAKEYGKP